MESIRFSDIAAYLTTFPQYDDELFVDVIYEMDDVVVEYEIKKHNDAMEESKRRK